MKNQVLDKMTINVGPQHPSTHGVLRLLIELEGETIKSCNPCVGYLHRGIEKMGQEMTYLQYLPVIDRVDYLSGSFCQQAFVQAVEDLNKIEVPKRARYLRVLLMELNRIASHLMWLGSFLLDLGATSPLFYCFRERETILEILEELTGQRMMYNYHTFGGVKKDIERETIKKIHAFINDFPQKTQEYEDIITFNPIFLKRTKNIGIISKNTAINYAITGVNSRASGLNYDIRKSKKYEIYDELEFNIPTLTKGDAWSRYLLRVREMRESLNIITQCVYWLKENEGEIKNESIKPLNLKVNEGTCVSLIEAPRGVLGCILHADGSTKPNRVKWRTGSFYAVQLLPKLVVNHTYADLMSIFGSLDVVLPEVDR